MLGFCESSVPGLQMFPFSSAGGRDNKFSSVSSSHGTNAFRLGPALTTSSNPNYPNYRTHLQMSMVLRLQCIILWGHEHSVKHRGFKMMALQHYGLNDSFFVGCLVDGGCQASCNTRNPKPGSSFSVLSPPVAASTVGSMVLAMQDGCIEGQNELSLFTSTAPHTVHIYPSLSC